MAENTRLITTFVDEKTVQMIEIAASATRDHIILIREAVHALRGGAARSIDVSLDTKEWKLSIRASK